ncbi:MAG: hypothetical protein LC796_00240 [Acidobacteria bacterium]|nr:hypothetical protein [Acidobacteriota bacterium]
MPRGSGIRVPGTLFLAGCIAVSGTLLAFEPPSPSAFRSGFEAQFPKADANGPALELESLAASMGIDLAPKDALKRVRPTEEQAAAYVGPGEYLEGQLKGAGERIAAPTVAVSRFLEDHASALDGAKFLLLRSEPRWEMDVTIGLRGPMANVLGHMRLQRLLLTRALLEASDGRPDDAIQTLEASWRLNESLASRPDFLSHLIVVAIARLQAGVLRKVDSPAYGWSDRLRDGKLFAGYLTGLQNEFWWNPDHRDLTGESGATGRVWRNLADRLQRGDVCRWTPASMNEVWYEAFASEIPDDEQQIMDITAMPSLKNSFFRWRRYLIDAELTALILDARGERAASRRHDWPAELLKAGRGVCADGKWSYRVAPNGTATIALESDVGEPGSSPFQLPLAFTAGIPAAPRKASARSPEPVF